MKVCIHLRPILDFEESQGNSIRDIEENAWSNTNYSINLLNRMDIERDEQAVQDIKYIKIFENNDPHYERQRGFFCEKCKHSIAGPL